MAHLCSRITAYCQNKQMHIVYSEEKSDYGSRTHWSAADKGSLSFSLALSLTVSVCISLWSPLLEMHRSPKAPHRWHSARLSQHNAPQSLKYLSELTGPQVQSGSGVIFQMCVRLGLGFQFPIEVLTARLLPPLPVSNLACWGHSVLTEFSIMSKEGNKEQIYLGRLRLVKISAANKFILNLIDLKHVCK